MSRSREDLVQVVYLVDDPRDLGRDGKVIQKKEENQERFVIKQATTNGSGT